MIQVDTVIWGDCLEHLRAIPNNSVDVCFADPPFNLDKNYGTHNDQMPLEEYLEWCEKWLLELVRVTKPTGSILVHNIPKWLTYYATILNKHTHFRHWIAWDAMSNPRGKTLLPAHYGILFYSKEPKGTKFYEIRAPHKKCRKCDAYLKDYGGKVDQRHAFGYLVSDVWTDIHRVRHAKRRDEEHPCQLPIHLLERLILMTTDVGDIVLDPFLGTGTTAIAAKNLQRHYIGIEIDPIYHKVALGKLEKITEPTLFQGRPASIYLGKVQSLRDCDAAELFPAQVTSTQKKRSKPPQPTNIVEVKVEKKPKTTKSEKITRLA